jgi:DNA-binding GntR family transcriptional regulator
MCTVSGKESAMSRLEDDYTPEEIQKMREEMHRLRESMQETKTNAQRALEKMRQLDPEFWKAFGFASERDYLVFVGWHELSNP